MTLLTLEVRLNVPLMRKVNKIGYIVYLDPRYRFTIFPECHQFQDLRLVTDAG